MSRSRLSRCYISVGKVTNDRVLCYGDNIDYDKMSTDVDEEEILRPVICIHSVHSAHWMYIYIYISLQSESCCENISGDA